MQSRSLLIKAQKREDRAGVNQSVAEGLINLIINQDGLVLKWTNFLVVLQGSSLAAVWLILSGELKFFPDGFPYHEIFIGFVALITILVTYFISSTIIREFDNQGYFLYRYCNLPEYREKIWSDSLSLKIQENIKKDKVGQGKIARQMKILSYLLILIWAAIELSAISLALGFGGRALQI